MHNRLTLPKGLATNAKKSTCLGSRANLLLPYKSNNMLRIITLLACFHITVATFGQWSNDPENPLMICNDPFLQSKPVVLGDGETGYYVFWIDNRSGIAQVFGQHLDTNGTPMWEGNGRQLTALTQSATNMQAAMLDDHSIMVAWTGYNDSVEANVLGADGYFFFPDDILVAGPEDYIWGSNGSSLTMQSYGTGCYISYVLTGYGYDDLYLSKVEMDGSLTWGYNGILVWDCGLGSAGNLHLLPDGAGGGYISWEYYGAHLQHFNADGTLNLASPTLITSCTDGIGGTYAGHPYYDIHLDADGALMSAWTSASRDVYAAKSDAAGTFAWPDSCRVIFSDPAIQEGIAFSGSGNDHYISWQDYNPDATGIYMQKFDENGNTLWDEPLYVDDAPLYIPVIKSVITSGGDVVVCYVAGGAFYAQKVRPDGTTEWPEPIQVLSSTYAPFYTEFTLIPTADDNVIGAARTFSYEEIVAFNLNYFSGDTLTEDTTTTTVYSFDQLQLEVYPNPARDQITLSLNDALPYALQIVNLQGQLVMFMEMNGVQSTDISQLSPGVYILQAFDASGNSQSTYLVKQ